MYINTALGSCLTITLLIIDYLRKFNTDYFQRKLLFAMLGSAFIAVLTDFISRVIAGLPGPAVRITMTTVISVFLVAQNCTYYLGAVFIDYYTYINTKRSKKFILIEYDFLTHIDNLMYKNKEEHRRAGDRREEAP
jgi:type IV secretory pathway VirB3-like protein